MLGGLLEYYGRQVSQCRALSDGVAEGLDAFKHGVSSFGSLMERTVSWSICMTSNMNSVSRPSQASGLQPLIRPGMP